MVSAKSLLIICCLALVESRHLELQNSMVKAVVDDRLGLVGLTELDPHGASLSFSSDSWSIQVGNRTWSPTNGCKAGISERTGPASASLTYACGRDLDVRVAYTVRPGAAFVEKRLAIATKGESISFQGAALFDGISVDLDSLGDVAEPDWYVRSNPFAARLSIAAFLRWPAAGRGAFVSVANPWGQFVASGSGLRAFYAANYTHDPKLQGRWFELEPAVIGPTSLSKYTNEGMNTGERVAFMRCVESYYLDHASRQNKTVKVNVAWDENDYQIDVGTEDGRTEYKRIIDRNAQFGVTHIVYEPRNTLHSTRFNTTDGWGWEEALWLSMGELLREGKWDPRTDEVPEDILGMVKYAGDRGVKLLAYAYPCLPFEKMREYFVNHSTNGNTVSLAPPQVQSYFIEVMTAFLEKSGAAGFAWDHDIFAGHASLQYEQWRAWMHILGTLRQRFPDMVMDHRQTNHMWGPWYQLAGSYAEPIAGDENPESYGVPIPSLHTDHVAGDHTRRVNYIYSTQQLLPPMRVPGFIFHQTERTDDDGHFYCSSGEKTCYNNSNTRDFDYLGYKYSVLSTVGTAGLNNVLTMIPARDIAEFTLLPREDVAFINGWLAWTDSNIDKLQNTQWIPTLSGPQIGNVDGTHAIAGDEGFVFLYNPNMGEMKVKLVVDESLGISNASSGGQWNIVELYPRESAPVATWKHGEQVEVSVGGSDVRVLALTKTNDEGHTARLVHATMVSAQISNSINSVELFAAAGPSGQEVVMAVSAAASKPTASSRVSVNGVHCGTTSKQESSIGVRFAGEPVLRVMPVSPDVPPLDFTGGWFNTTFSIPNSVKQQLQKRAQQYPVPWTASAQGCGQPHCVDDSKATWLVPSRLLLNPFIAHPSDTMAVDLYVDGAKLTLGKSYNSRGRNISGCFLGFYYDASDITADIRHTLALHLPLIKQGDFQGLFWENVETEYTSKVESCQVLTDRMTTTPNVYI